MILVQREPLVGENADTKVIPNGLVREARNTRRVGAYGDPVRYQWGVYVSIQNEWTIYRQFGWYRRGLKAFVPILGMKAFFIYLITQKGE